MREGDRESRKLNIVRDREREKGRKGLGRVF